MEMQTFWNGCVTSIRFCPFPGDGYNAVSVCLLAKLQGGHRPFDTTQRRSRSVTSVPIPKELGVFLPRLSTRSSFLSPLGAGIHDTVGLVIVKLETHSSFLRKQESIWS